MPRLLESNCHCNLLLAFKDPRGTRSLISQDNYVVLPLTWTGGYCYSQELIKETLTYEDYLGYRTEAWAQLGVHMQCHHKDGIYTANRNTASTPFTSPIWSACRSSIVHLEEMADSTVKCMWLMRTRILMRAIAVATGIKEKNIHWLNQLLSIWKLSKRLSITAAVLHLAENLA